MTLLPLSAAARFALTDCGRFLRRLAVPILVLGLWEVGADMGWIDAYFLPAPHVILSTFWELLRSGVLIADVTISLYRLVLGYVLGACAGILLGLLTGRSRIVGDLIDPLIQALRPVSPIALLPLAIVYFGIGDLQKIVLIAYSTFFPVVVNTYFGVRAVDPFAIMAAKTLGAARPVDMYREVILPAAMPQIFTGLRISLGISFIVIIAAEMVAAQSGIGFRILDSERIFRLDIVYAGIVVISGLGLIFDAAFMQVRRTVLPWFRET